MKLFKTKIPASKINLQLITAYLKGKIGESFTVLKTPDDKVAVTINSDEDATFFELKDFEETLKDMLIEAKGILGDDDSSDTMKSVLDELKKSRKYVNYK